MSKPNLTSAEYAALKKPAVYELKVKGLGATYVATAAFTEVVDRFPGEALQSGLRLKYAVSVVEKGRQRPLVTFDFYCSIQDFRDRVRGMEYYSMTGHGHQFFAGKPLHPLFHREMSLDSLKSAVYCLAVDALCYKDAKDVLGFAGEMGYDLNTEAERNRVRTVFDACKKLYESAEQLGWYPPQLRQIVDYMQESEGM